MKAIWNGEVIAESDDTVVVDGNHYFPADKVHAACLEPSSTRSVCPWKGMAGYYNVRAGGRTNPDAAWYYADPQAGGDRHQGSNRVLARRADRRVILR